MAIKTSARDYPCFSCVKLMQYNGCRNFKIFIIENNIYFFDYWSA